MILPTISIINEVGVYTHPGKIGDIIYSLAAIREDLRVNGVDRAKLLFYNDPDLTLGQMTTDIVNNMEPLLLSLPYIESATLSEQPVHCRLTHWRNWLKQYDTIAAAHLASLGFTEFSSLSVPWISVSPMPAYRVIFSLTPRWRDNPHFPWQMLANEYAQIAGFVGTTDEYDAFCTSIGFAMPYVKTSCLLSLARTIAGSDLFVGNQNASFALASAMRIPRILDCSTAYDNCDWGSPECIAVRKNCTITIGRCDWLLTNGRTLSRL